MREQIPDGKELLCGGVLALALFLAACGDDDITTLERCELSRDAIDFGTVTTLPSGVLSRTHIEPLVVRNTGLRDLHVEIEITTPGSPGAPQFTLPPEYAVYEFTLAPGDSDSVRVGAVLQPNTTTGEFTGTIDLGTRCGILPITIEVVPE